MAPIGATPTVQGYSNTRNQKQDKLSAKENIDEEIGENSENS